MIQAPAPWAIWAWRINRHSLWAAEGSKGLWSKSWALAQTSGQLASSREGKPEDKAHVREAEPTPGRAGNNTVLGGPEDVDPGSQKEPGEKSEVLKKPTH